MSNNRKFILTYGLFLGWLLSFIFNGSMFIVLISSAAYSVTALQIVCLILPQIVMITYVLIKKPVKPNSNHIPIALGMCFVGTLISLVFGHGITTIFSYVMCLIALNIAGVGTLLFIYSSCICFVKFDVVDNSFRSMAYIVLIANLMVNICEIMIEFHLVTLSAVLVLLLIVAAFAVSFTYKNRDAFRRPNYDIELNKSSMFLICLTFFLLNIGGGIVFEVIKPITRVSHAFAQYAYILPYILSTLCVLFFLRSKQVSAIDTLLIFAAILIIIGFLLFQMKGTPIIVIASDFFIQSGYAIIDVFMWGLAIRFAYVYARYYEVSCYTMSCNVTAVLLGRVISQQMIKADASDDIIIFIGLIGLFLAIIIITALYKITVRELNTAMHSIRGEAEKEKALEALKNHVGLTKREKQIVDMLIIPMDNRSIAKKLVISENTLKTHCSNIYKKLGVKNKRELKYLYDMKMNNKA